MVQVGVPRLAVKAKMAQDGLDSSILESVECFPNKFSLIKIKNTKAFSHVSVSVEQMPVIVTTRNSRVCQEQIKCKSQENNFLINDFFYLLLKLYSSSN